MAQFGLGVHPKPINCTGVGFCEPEATPNGSYYSGQIALLRHTQNDVVDSRRWAKRSKTVELILIARQQALLWADWAPQ